MQENFPFSRKEMRDCRKNLILYINLCPFRISFHVHKYEIASVKRIFFMNELKAAVSSKMGVLSHEILAFIEREENVDAASGLVRPQHRPLTLDLLLPSCLRFCG